MKQQSGAPEKLKINKPSSLLTQEENEHIFSLLGRRCQSMATAVVQLYITESPAHSLWIKRNTGIACFIRDSTKRSYFVRIYCLMKNELIWEEEMYESIYINKSKEYLLDFEGRECLIALNFASESEANQFYKTATNTISNRSKRRQDTNKRRSRRIPPPTPNASAQPEEPAVVLRNAAPPSATMQMSQFSQMSPSSIPSSGLRNKKPGNRKLTKADISMPTDFKHVVHVGWTAQKGFDLNGEEVDNLNHFLERAGVSEQQLNDRETRAFIYDFIQSNNVLDSVKLENSDQSGRHAPPPVPSRLHNGTQRTAPPPPPANSVQQRQPLPPLPKTTPHRATPPGRPPPMTTNNTPTSAAPIPPPPPPPPIENVPMPPPPPPMNADFAPRPVANTPRNALLESIEKGITLKKVEHTQNAENVTNNGGGDDSRNDLLKSIRQGVELRPAAERELGAQRESDSGGTGTDALADALRRALLERGRRLRSSDEESESSDNDGEWDD
ncbi:neural Wiskott-Aldrich syndrome protein isoform X1 [Bradysia coprophila]|uniref:neural Wiskott-Aldrich syndrome protein isoform X1 n=1 Tax=Bradysia coprophila TaxID=38358 RepID=UPI00187D9C1D|nr:neural Wiskott-Aldrich syndrome protein isoform X1 [Bradysia coprophila]